MAKKPPQKGSVEWHKLPSAPQGYEELEVGLKYVGSHAAGEWNLRGHKLTLEEAARKIQTKADGHSSEYIGELKKLSLDILQECVAGVRPVEGLGEDDAAGALELLEYLGEEVETKVAQLAKNQQSLTLRQQFHSEGASE